MCNSTASGICILARRLRRSTVSTTCGPTSGGRPQGRFGRAESIEVHQRHAVAEAPVDLREASGKWRRLSHLAPREMVARTDSGSMLRPSSVGPASGRARGRIDAARKGPSHRQDRVWRASNPPVSGR